MQQTRNPGFLRNLRSVGPTVAFAGLVTCDLLSGRLAGIEIILSVGIAVATTAFWPRIRGCVGFLGRTSDSPEGHWTPGRSGTDTGFGFVASQRDLE